MTNDEIILRDLQAIKADMGYPYLTHALDCTTVIAAHVHEWRELLLDIQASLGFRESWMKPELEARLNKALGPVRDILIAKMREEIANGAGK